jgi:hypothetical protein
MEMKVLTPLLSSNRLLATLGNSLTLYLERELSAFLFPSLFTNFFEAALLRNPTPTTGSVCSGLVHNDDDDDDDSDDDEDDDDDDDDSEQNKASSRKTAVKKLARRLGNKFYRYYVGSSFNDFVKHKFRTLGMDKDSTRNVAFRIGLLSAQIEKLKQKKAKEKKK